MRTRRALRVILPIACVALPALAAVGCGGSGHAADQSVLFTQSATNGSLKPSGSGEMTLILHGVAPQVVWFQDRPNRRAGHLNAAGLIPGWRPFGFEGDAPNAALTLLDAPDNADTVIVELLRRPRYDPAHHTMTYAVRELSKPPGELAGFEDDADVGVPKHFAAASLFIDAAQVTGGTIENISRRDAFLAAAEAAEQQMRHQREPDSPAFRRPGG